MTIIVWSWNRISCSIKGDMLFWIFISFHHIINIIIGLIGQYATLMLDVEMRYYRDFRVSMVEGGRVVSSF